MNLYKRTFLLGEISYRFSQIYVLPTAFHFRIASQCTLLWGTSGDYFPKKLLNLTQVLILFFTRLYFVSGLKTYFQPASSQRPTLHIDPWVTDLKHALAQNTHACGRIKISHFDWFRKSLPTTMQSGLSVLCLTNWGGVGAASQESLGRRPSPFSGHQDPGEWKPQLSMAKYIHMTFMWAWYRYRSHRLKGSCHFGLTKIEKHFRKKIGFVCQWRIFLKRNSCYETEIWRPRWC